MNDQDEKHQDLRLDYLERRRRSSGVTTGPRERRAQNAICDEAGGARYND